MKLTPVQLNRVKELKTHIVFNQALGNYKEFKAAVKEYSKLAVQDFDTIMQLPSSSVSNVPLFSKMGMRMFKIWVLEKFRIKTPEERLLKKMSKEYYARKLIKKR
ncbi:hypothetical protein IKR55_03755 [bacterium]|nr:hypothetical protein [bacterium]